MKDSLRDWRRRRLTLINVLRSRGLATWQDEQEAAQHERALAIEAHRARRGPVGNGEWRRVRLRELDMLRDKGLASWADEEEARMLERSLILEEPRRADRLRAMS